MAQIKLKIIDKQFALRKMQNIQDCPCVALSVGRVNVNVCFAMGEGRRKAKNPI